MLNNRVIVLAVALSLLFVLAPSAIRAQGTNSGTITGTVTDPSGAVVPGATVTLTDVSTNASRSVTTNNAGHYIFVDVPPGTYDVRIKKAGFREAKLSKQVVTVGTTLTFNSALVVGQANEVIEVKPAEGAELQTLNATVGQSISGEMLQSLPSLSRDVSTFITLQPGVSPEGSVAGAVYDQSSFLLDGGQNTNDMDGSMTIYTPSYAGDPSGGITQNTFTGTGGTAAGGGGGPTGVMPTPLDSIEEFKVGTTNQTADFNSSAGAQVSMVTKRGTKTWHGTAYEYYLDNNFDANTWDNNANKQKIPSYHYSRFGGAVGGPIIPQKIWGGETYFFFNYQGFRFPNSETIERAVPSPTMRAGLLVFGCPSGATTIAGCNVFNLNNAPVQYTGPGANPANPTYPVAACPAGPCDPRALGRNPQISQIWTKYMPLPNESNCGLSRCDLTLASSGVGVGNIGGFRANLPLTQRDDFAVVRVDHDFGPKWHFMSSYRYYHLTRATDNQIDIGCFFCTTPAPGKVSSLANRPQVPWFLATGLTTNITSNFTNDFHYSYLRNFWSRISKGGPPQLPGQGAALEPLGESRFQALIPFNVDTQNVRTRYWNGKDHMIRDDLTLLRGNHIFQWGGTYQHNWNGHQRTDNGGGINYFPSYLMGIAASSLGGIPATGFGGPNTPAVLTSSQATRWSRDYGIVLGITNITQQAYTRTGPNLKLNPPLTPAMDQSTIPFYNVYFSDTWHLKPTFTLTYGLGWTLEMPPVEKEGKQVELVDQANQLIGVQSYINSRQAAALQGVVYNPQVGFTLVGNSENGRKYPYNPYYGSFSPRVAAAWSPNYDSGFLGSVLGRGKSVIRGGFSLIYGRLNGVDLVLVPLLGTGLIQPVQCFHPLSNGTCGGSAATPLNAFRIGPGPSFDGLTAPIPAASPTLPQPDFPGINDVSAAAGEALDPKFRPNKSYQFDFTIQRQLSRKMTIEAGYIGRIIRNEYQPVNINAVPYMFTRGGQRFDKAYANLVMQYCGGVAGLAGGANNPTTGGCTGNLAAVTPQPFFETALAGTGYCTVAGAANCTQAVAINEGNTGTGNLSNQSVWSLWSDLDNGGFNFGRTMLNTPFTPPGTFGANGQLTSGIGVNASIGHGNYNALFLSFRMSDWHGLTAQSNFTYGKTMGTGAVVQATSEYTVVDPYNIDRGYTLQNWDRKFVYNTYMAYTPPYFKSQQGVVGHLLGGWSFAPILSAASGLPLPVDTSNFNLTSFIGGGQSFGSSDGANFGSTEQAILIPGPGCSLSALGNSRHNKVPGDPASGIGTTGFAVNLFSNPVAANNCFRNPVLGFDNGHNGYVLRGQSFWNLDFSLRKNTRITERVSTEFQVVFTNLFNHVVLFDPTGGGVGDLALNDNNAFGTLGGQINTPRSIEFGFRIRF